MVSEKAVAVLLVLAIVLAVISVAITINVNSSINNIGAGSLSKQGNAGNVQLVVEPNSAGAGAGGGSIE